MFRCKQFTIDQTGCAMKINTDGVLLGAMAAADDPKIVLDIGTGTGVIALMLAQKYSTAKVDAVEIDEAAARTAERNFKASPFGDRLAMYAMDFESYFTQFPERKYDLIVSNPPFYIDSLKSPGRQKSLAKHADTDFFERLVKRASSHLTPEGICWLILPLITGQTVEKMAGALNMYPQKMVLVQSYPQSAVHRVILSLGFNKVQVQMSNLVIYEEEGINSAAYKQLLKSYFLAF